MNGRFRILPEHVDDALALFGEIGVEPVRVCHRDDGAIAIEVAELTEEQGQALAVNFRPEWSAIIGIVDSPIFGTKH